MARFASFTLFGGSYVLGSHAASFNPTGPRLDIQVAPSMLIWLPNFLFVLNIFFSIRILPEFVFEISLTPAEGSEHQSRGGAL